MTLRLLILICLFASSLYGGSPVQQRRRSSSEQPLSYILNDSFNVAIPVGSLTGPASPGPGTWTAVDSENKMSQVGGKLVFSGGRTIPVLNDPYRVYNSTTRNIGKTFIIGLTPVLTTMLFESGYFNSTTLHSGGVTTSGEVLLWTTTGGNVKVVDNGNATITVGVFTNLPSIYAISLSSTGAYYFQSNSLIWVSRRGTTTPLYCGVADYTGAYPVSFIKIPPQPLIIRPLLSQTAAGANGTVITQSDSVSPDGYNLAPVLWSGSMYVTNGGFTWEPVAGTNVLLNGDFEAGDVNWTKAASWSITGGKAVATASGAASKIFQNVGTNGVYYKASFDITDYTSGTMSLYLENPGTALGTVYGAIGSYTNIIKGVGSNLGLRIATTANLSCDNVSFQPLPLPEITRLANIGDANQLAYGSMTNVTGFQSGLVLRVNATNNLTDGIFVYYDSGSVKVDILTNSVFLPIATVVTTYSAGARLGTRIGADGKLWVWYAEALVTGAPFDLSGYATLQTGTCAGLFLTSSQCRFVTASVHPESDPLNRYGWKGYLDKYANERN